VNSPYAWHDYVQDVVRQYPERVKVYDSLDQDAKKEVDAVAAACRLLDLEEENKELQLRVITARYWTDHKRPVDLIAMDLFACSNTVKRWDRKFLRNVAALLGVYTPANSPDQLPSA